MDNLISVSAIVQPGLLNFLWILMLLHFLELPYNDLMTSPIKKDEVVKE
jgi:hypothetical protein